ncbi:MAG TPA: alpha/beta hydrolase [Planctomycetaceae bacterium]|nr:alpha/beta hydrolase [Planctomycetaceae bacterium]
MKLSIPIALAFLIPAASQPLGAGEYRAKLSGHGFAPVNGTRIYYEVAGKGEPLVLIHGGNLDSRMWDDQFANYAKRYRVVRYDVRGFGGSIRPADQAYSNADDLAGLLDYLEMPKAHLVGLSLGGLIALDFAVTRPTRVLSMVLAGPGLSGYEKSDPDGEEAWWVRVQAARDEGAEKVVEMWLKDPYMAPAMENPTLAERLRYLARENAHYWLQNPILQRPPRPPAAQKLREIKVPTLVILGERDLPRSVEISARLLRDINGTKKVVIPGAGHMVNMERPGGFDRAVMEFLSEKPRTGPRP